MKKVFQDKFGEEGNCVQACICSILELPLSEAPEVPPDKSWSQILNRWLAQYELILVAIDWFEPVQKFRLYPYDCYFIVCGKSPRGLGHAVVYRGNFLVHDPHPDGGGLVDNPDSLYFLCPKKIQEVG